MSRTLSQSAIIAAYREHSKDVFLVLLTIEEPSLSVPIRLVNNPEEIVSNGETFTPFPFEMVLPIDDGKSTPSLTVTIDNVSLEIIAILRALRSPPMVTVEVVLADSPDTVEMAVSGMAVREINANAQQITFTITDDDWLNTRWPSMEYDMTHFRGLFRG